MSAKTVARKQTTLKTLSREIRNAESRLELLQLQRKALAREINALREENDILTEDTETALQQYEKIQRSLRTIQIQYLMWSAEKSAWAVTNRGEYDKLAARLKDVIQQYPIQDEYGVDIWPSVEELVESLPQQIAFPWLNGVIALSETRQIDEQVKSRLVPIWANTLLSLDYPCGVERIEPQNFTDAAALFVNRLSQIDAQKAQFITNKMKNYSVCGEHWYNMVIDFAKRLEREGADDEGVMNEFRQYLSDYHTLLQFLDQVEK